MRPRGLRSVWRWATPTYGFEKGQPSRMVERRDAIAADLAACGCEPLMREGRTSTEH